MTLTPTQKKQLRINAAQLRPVILLGNKGLTEAVQHEIGAALAAHELIKIRLHDPNRANRLRDTASICVYHNAELIQAIGHVIVIYKPQQQVS